MHDVYLMRNNSLSEEISIVMHNEFYAAWKAAVSAVAAGSRLTAKAESPHAEASWKPFCVTAKAARLHSSSWLTIENLLKIDTVSTPSKLNIQESYI